MSAYVFRLIGCQESLLMEVEAPALPDLVYILSRCRFVVGRLVEVDGQAVSRAIAILVNRIEAITEPE